MDAGQPCLEICEDEMDDGQKPYSQTNTTPGGCMRQPDKHALNMTASGRLPTSGALRLCSGQSPVGTDSSGRTLVKGGRPMDCWQMIRDLRPSSDDIRTVLVVED